MEKRNSECIKRKKDLKEMWSREQKKLSECKSALKAAKSKYTMLGQELARVSYFVSYVYVLNYQVKYVTLFLTSKVEINERYS